MAQILTQRLLRPILVFWVFLEFSIFSSKIAFFAIILADNLTGVLSFVLLGRVEVSLVDLSH